LIFTTRVKIYSITLPRILSLISALVTELVKNGLSGQEQEYYLATWRVECWISSLY